MEYKFHLSISEFARLTGIKRANLIFYDKIGILSPEYRGENSYRYYTRTQLNSAYLVTALREMGISLDEIKRYAEGRTPQRMIALFELQEERIKDELKKLNHMREIMRLYTDMAEEALTNETNAIKIIEQEKEPIFVSPISKDGLTYDEETIAFYDYATEHNVPLNYPFGAIISKDSLNKKETEAVHRYFFKCKHGKNAYKPSGRYVVAYGNCGYGKAREVYSRLLEYINENGLAICGDAYEEYLLNEMSTQNEDEYLVRIEIMVND